jgi:hypothetical protein
MLIFSISFPDLMKNSYFMDTPKKGLGWKEAQRQGDFISNFSIYTYTPQNIYTRSVRVFDKYL